MTKTSIEDKVGMALWKLIAGAVASGSILVGAIYWASSVDYTAKQALKLGEENKVKIDQLYLQLQSQSTSLTELRVEAKFQTALLQELKSKIK